MLKKILAILSIAAFHLILTKFILSATTARISAHVFKDPASFIPVMLVKVTQILSFPIISLSLYPRKWYPGNLIVIPFFFNSLIWALIIYGGFLIIKKGKQKSQKN